MLFVDVTGCARTDLGPGDLELGESQEPTSVDDAGTPPPEREPPGEQVPNEQQEPPEQEPPEEPEEPEQPEQPEEPEQPLEPEEPPEEQPTMVPGCVPTGAESCNGVDDDCNGQVDDLPPVACDDGGFSYCVAGAMSECPRQCETCMPGSETICFVSYCYFWGVQTCAGDGKSLSGCKEEPPPSACRDIAVDHQKSRQLEQCCIDEGYCCKDDFDLDGDGDTGDYVGSCSEVLCGND